MASCAPLILWMSVAVESNDLRPERVLHWWGKSRPEALESGESLEAITHSMILEKVSRRRMIWKEAGVLQEGFSSLSR